MKKTTERETTQETTTPDIMWFTPSVGVTSTELCFIQLATKTTVLIYVHSCRSFLYPLTKTSAHTAAEVVHAHSWDLTFPYKISLSFALIFLYIKSLTFSYLKKCLFIHRAITKPWLQTMGTQNPKPWS